MRDQINQALKDAMKSGDKLKVSTLRLISSTLKDRDIYARGLGRGQATDEEVLEALARMIKQRQESARLFDEGKRPELAEQERGEIAIIQSYMPKQLGEDEVKSAIAAAIADTGAASVKDMGKVMAALKARHAGQMDFSKASALVKAMLG